MQNRKGVVLAGGSESRLFPKAMAVSKQLLAIYDKRMIYHPLSVFMLADVLDIAIVTPLHNPAQFKRSLGNGQKRVVSLTYIVLDAPNGLTEVYINAESFLDRHPSAMILEENIFYGDGLTDVLASAAARYEGGTVFGCCVLDLKRCGVFDNQEHAISLVKKTKQLASQSAVIWNYFLDATASGQAKLISPSERGEIEITSLLRQYLGASSLPVKKFTCGHTWLHTCTHRILLDAGNFVLKLQRRQALLVRSLDKFAFTRSWISKNPLLAHKDCFSQIAYGQQYSSTA